jgi:hypothetical protein
MDRGADDGGGVEGVEVGVGRRGREDERVALVYQLRPVADAVDEVAEEDEVEAVFTPHPRLFHVV